MIFRIGQVLQCQSIHYTLTSVRMWEGWPGNISGGQCVRNHPVGDLVIFGAIRSIILQLGLVNSLD